MVCEDDREKNEECTRQSTGLSIFRISHRGLQRNEVVSTVRVHTDRDTRVPQDVCCASVPGAEPVPSLISRARSVMVPSLSGHQMSTATGVEAKTEMAAPHASGAAR